MFSVHGGAEQVREVFQPPWAPSCLLCTTARLPEPSGLAQRLPPPPVRISARTPDILTEIFHIFLQSLQSNTGIVLQIGPRSLLTSISFRINYSWSFNHSTLCSHEKLTSSLISKLTPHRKHNASPLQRPVSQCSSEIREMFILRTVNNSTMCRIESCLNVETSGIYSNHFTFNT
jgi:hypothetical protein